MDDLLLFTPTKESHFCQVGRFAEGFMQNRLKISPKKCQLFKTEL